jgi:hypothetical protein
MGEEVEVGGHSERASNHRTEPTRRACTCAIAFGELAH